MGFGQINDEKCCISHRFLKKNSGKSIADAVKELKLDVSPTTARRAAHAGGLKGRKPVRKPFVSLSNRLKRVKWCKDHASFDFSTVLLTDEKVWHPHGLRKGFVWRPDGMRYHHKFMWSRRQGGGGSLMVWGAISRTRTYPLVKIEGKLDADAHCAMLKQFFKENKLPGSRASRARLPWTFMQDNAPCHKARKTMQLLASHHAKVLPWPANSPDLNPIENLWGWLQKRVYEHGNFSNTKDLFKALQKEWAGVPASLLDTLYSSMDVRMDLVRAKRGFPTRY